MKKVKPIADILQELKKRYDQDKQGWKVFAGKDREGFNDMYILHRSTLWQLKMEKVKPFQYIGYGIRLGKMSESFDKEIKKWKPVFFELLSPQKDGSIIIARGIEKYSTEGVMGLREMISKKQQELDLKLTNELRKLIFRRYPEVRAYVT